MNKKQLLEFLEPYTGNVEIMIVFGQDKNNLTIVKPVISAIPISRGFESEKIEGEETEEIWLGFGEET